MCGFEAKNKLLIRQIRPAFESHFFLQDMNDVIINHVLVQMSIKPERIAIFKHSIHCAVIFS
jgi:hypothetical protein